MADIQNKTNHRIKPKTPCFLGCFGFYRKGAKKISVKDDSSNITNEESSSPGWFCWSRFRRNSFRTVPIDSADNVFDPTSSQAEIDSSKSKFKCKSKCKELYRLFIKRRHQSTKTTPSQKTPTAVKASSHQEPEPELEPESEPEPKPELEPKPQPEPEPEPETKEILPVEQTRHVPEQNVVVENRRSFERGESSKDETHQKRLSFQRKIESIRNGSSQPVSPDNKPKPGRNVPKLSHSAPFPALIPEKRAYTQTRVTSKKSRKNNNAKVNELDPLAGLSILMVTLVIMLIYGRVCAIMCTSAWLYAIPRLRAATYNDRLITKFNDEPDINSEEYKMKVVFEGFLERDRRDGL